MSVYTSLFISLCLSECVSLHSLISLILVYRVALLVLLFEFVSESNSEFFSESNGNGNDLGLSVRVKISIHPCKVVWLLPSMYVYVGLTQQMIYTVQNL